MPGLNNPPPVQPGLMQRRRGPYALTNAIQLHMIAISMNLLQLALKQMRQRALSTWLTILSVALGVALAIAILIVQREGASLFGQADFGYDTLVGARGAKIQLVMSTVYHLDASPGNIPYSLYTDMLDGGRYRPFVRLAVPYMVGDTHEGFPIVGTSPLLFNADDTGTPTGADGAMRFEYRLGRAHAFAQGRSFHGRKFEAVLGADVATRLNMKIGDTFQATHGNPRPGEKADIHSETWTVVGILSPTRTISDREIYIPLISSYTIAEHGKALMHQDLARKGVDSSVLGKLSLGQLREMTALKAQQEALVHNHAHHGHGHDHDHDHDHDDKNYVLNEDGTIDLLVPEESWALSAILVRSASPAMGVQLQYAINNGNEASAISPAVTMASFFDMFLKGSLQVLWLIAVLVTLVAAISILVSIYNSIVGRLRDIAILRALGATRLRVLAIICTEAVVIGVVGGVLGLAAGHALAFGGSLIMERLMGQGIAWNVISRNELYYLAGVIALCLLASLVPALKAYRSPVATNLVTQ